MLDQIIPQHSKLSPSGAATWLGCPGSVEAQAGLPDTSSFFAAEGTAAHELAAWALTEDRIPHEREGQVIVVEEEDEDYEITVSEDMCDHVQSYIDGINLLRAATTPTKRWEAIETRVFTPVDECNGTADYMMYDVASDHLHIMDLKFGKGIKVKAEANKQLMIYGWGAGRAIYKKFSKIPAHFTLHISQPRIGNYDDVTYDQETFIGLVGEIEQGALLALQPDAPRIPGTAQCRWCKAKATCPELNGFVIETVTHEFPIIEGELAAGGRGADPHIYEERLAIAMDRVDLVKGWAKAIEGAVFSALEEGLAIEGYKLVEGRSSRGWSLDEAEMNLELRKRKYKLKVADFTEQKLLTAPALEKRLGKKNFTDKLRDLVSKPAGKPTLAESSDKRPAIFPAEQFADITSATGVI